MGSRPGRSWCVACFVVGLLAWPEAAQAQGSSLWVASADGSNARELADGVFPGSNLNPTPASWSPDGRQIAYAETRLPGRGGIHVISVDGGRPRRVVRGGTGAAWSPAGNVIAYNAGPPNWIQLHDLDSGSTSTLVGYGSDPNPGATGYITGAGGPVWSPNAGLVAFSAIATHSGGAPGSSGLWVVNADGTNRRPVLEGSIDNGTITAHSFTPDGKIRFPIGSGSWDQVAVDGSGRVAVPAPAGATQASWSRQGHLIAYVSGAQPGARDPNIYVADALGGPGSKVTTGSWPVFSPSAGQIAFLRRTTDAESQPLPRKQPLTITRVSGAVRYQTPGGRERRLRSTRRVPPDTVIDVTHGTVRADAGRGSWRGTLTGGKFRVERASSRGPISRLHLAGRLARCIPGSTAAVRRLSGTTRGLPSVIATRSTLAVAHAARWTVTDRCDDSTLTVMHRGRATLRDRGRPGTTITLRAGRSYLARP